MRAAARRIALLLAIAIEIVVSSLVDAGAPALLVVVGAGTGGLFLFRKLRPQGGPSAETWELRENRGLEWLGGTRVVVPGLPASQEISFPLISIGWGGVDPGRKDRPRGTLCSL